MRPETSEWNISVCGLNCAQCPIYQAYHNRDVEAQREISQRIFGNNAEYSPEDIKCDGCRGSLDVHWNPECTFKPCAEAKGHTFCFECNLFPCNRLETFANDIPHHQRTIVNMKRMKEIGLAAWIQEQEAQGQCVFCP